MSCMICLIAYGLVIPSHVGVHQLRRDSCSAARSGSRKWSAKYTCLTPLALFAHSCSRAGDKLSCKSPEREESSDGPPAIAYGDA